MGKKFVFKSCPPDKLMALVEATMAAKKQSSEPSPSAKRKIRPSSVADLMKKAKVVPTVHNSQSSTDLEKCRMRKEIEDLRGEKLGLEEKLNISRRKCEERDERLVKMGKEIEDLWREKLDSNQTINELKRKEIEATQTIDKLRVRLETALATMLRVEVEDLSTLINGSHIFSAAATNAEEEENVNLPNSNKGGSDCLGNDNVNADGVVMSPEVHATSDHSGGSGGVGSSKKGGKNLVHSGTKDDGANAVVISTSGFVDGSAVAESNGIVQDIEGKEAEVKGRNASVMQSSAEVEVEVVGGKTKVSSSPAGIGNVMVICDNDDESNAQTNKRNMIDDSPTNRSIKRKKFVASTTSSSLPSRLEETCTDSDDDSCSSTYMEKLIDTLRNKGCEND